MFSVYAQRVPASVPCDVSRGCGRWKYSSSRVAERSATASPSPTLPSLIHPWGLGEDSGGSGCVVSRPSSTLLWQRPAGAARSRSPRPPARARAPERAFPVRASPVRAQSASPARARSSCGPRRGAGAARSYREGLLACTPRRFRRTKKMRNRFVLLSHLSCACIFCVICRTIDCVLHPACLPRVFFFVSIEHFW